MTTSALDSSDHTAEKYRHRIAFQWVSAEEISGEAKRDDKATRNYRVARVFGKFADRLTDTLFLATPGVVVHEFGHAVAARLCGQEFVEMRISKDSWGGGDTEFAPPIVDGKRKLPTKAQDTFISLAGPLLHIIFSTILLVDVAAVAHYVPMSKMGRACFVIVAAPLAGSGLISEAGYAIVSLKNKDSEGDFAHIKKNGKRHLAFSFLAIITVLAIGVLGVNQMYHFIPHLYI